MSIKLIQPAPVERDEYGFWSHPELPEWDESTTVKTVHDWYEAQGLERSTVLFEDNAPEELIRAWEETGEADCAKWQPTPPKGDGWFILSIFDTEDGPICIFARPLARIVEPPKHIESSPFPSAEFRYFVFDPMDSDFVCFRTAEERDARVQDIINMYCDEGWDESVEQVCVGQVDGKAQQVNVKHRPEKLDEEGNDEDGEYWGEYETKCDYQIVPFPPRSSDEEELKAITGMLYMLENREWAEHAGKGELSIRLEQAITSLHNELAKARERTASEAVLSVLAERQRQIQFEGFTPEHDDKYRIGELSAAAGCYALFTDAFPNEGQPPKDWPWPAEWWKPKFYRYDLVRATALLLAEIERFDRAQVKAQTEGW